jgi:hypothetical protein
LEKRERVVEVHFRSALRTVVVDELEIRTEAGLEVSHQVLAVFDRIDHAQLQGFLCRVGTAVDDLAHLAFVAVEAGVGDVLDQPLV